VKLQAELNLKNALIFVPGCGFDGSNLACYDTVFNENSLDFNGDVVWARNVPDLNERVTAAYRGGMSAQQLGSSFSRPPTSRNRRSPAKPP
jgi:hypothetical protein